MGLGDDFAVQDEDQAFRKMKLRAEDVQGRNVLTNFWVSVSGTYFVLLLSWDALCSYI